MLKIFINLVAISYADCKQNKPYIKKSSKYNLNITIKNTSTKKIKPSKQQNKYNFIRKNIVTFF